MQICSELKLWLVQCDHRTVSEMAAGWAESGLLVRAVRGHKMRSRQRRFDEFAAALQFPLYLGDNWDAFDDCLADLSWLRAQTGYVVLFSDSEEVLLDAPADDLAWLVRALSSACEELAQPIELGEWWDRPALAFHVVLQSSPGPSALSTTRWTDAGASVEAPPA